MFFMVGDAALEGEKERWIVGGGGGGGGLLAKKPRVSRHSYPLHVIASSLCTLSEPCFPQFLETRTLVLSLLSAALSRTPAVQCFAQPRITQTHGM